MKKADYNRLLKLYPRQKWLVEKEGEVSELLSSCKEPEHKRLIFELLENFNYVDNDLMNKYLESMADYIVNKSGFTLERTQIVAMSMDSSPDSSQWIIHFLKKYLTKIGWNNVKMSNNFSKGVKLLKKEGLDQIILVDEFIGSGQSILGRIAHLKRVISEEVVYEIKGCFIAGMEHGIDAVKEHFSEFTCFLPLSKGITDRYIGSQLDENLKSMDQLEDTLLQRINDKSLDSYRLGYNKTETLYSSEGNTPNSVFPIFWWQYDIEENLRNTLLIRNEAELGL